MKLKFKDFLVEIEFLFLVVIFISIFSLKVRNFLEYFYLCYLFIIFHEFSHIFIANIFGKEVEKINFCMSGVNVKFLEKKYFLSNQVKYIDEILIYLAGPLSNFILAIIFNNIDLVFNINIFLGIINLLPIYPLDGYNVLKNILEIKENKDKNLNLVSLVFIIILLIISVFEILLFKNFSLSIFVLYLYIINAKYCKKKSYNVKRYCLKRM